MLNGIRDWLATQWAMPDLKRNQRAVKLDDLRSLLLLFIPALCFGAGLFILRETHPRFSWLHDLRQFPWQFWAIGCFGSIASIGGVGDWLFHKVYVTVGPNEHHSHLLALGMGSIVFLLMAIASLLEQPIDMLIPIVIALLATCVLICYDEFAFHLRRCKPFETLLHRLLVFGNAAAFLCWLHWLSIVR